jgi:hypothetical protein
MMQKLMYRIGRPDEEEELRLDFLDGMSRTVEERIKLGLVVFDIPVINDKPYRIFEKMQEYRKWLQKEVPRYLGYYW